MRIKKNDAKKEDFDEKYLYVMILSIAKYVYAIPVEMNSDFHSKTIHEKEIKLGYVCFPESSFRETTFQTFLCLFATRKVGQRKTLSSQRKIWFGFQENVFSFSYVCFPETTFQTFMCLFAIRKVSQWKAFSSQRKI
jgi:hypothetical protein